MSRGTINENNGICIGDNNININDHEIIEIEDSDDENPVIIEIDDDDDDDVEEDDYYNNNSDDDDAVAVDTVPSAVSSAPKITANLDTSAFFGDHMYTSGSEEEGEILEDSTATPMSIVGSISFEATTEAERNVAKAARILTRSNADAIDAPTFESIAAKSTHSWDKSTMMVADLLSRDAGVVLAEAFPGPALRHAPMIPQTSAAFCNIHLPIIDTPVQPCQDALHNDALPFSGLQVDHARDGTEDATVTDAAGTTTIAKNSVVQAAKVMPSPTSEACDSDQEEMSTGSSRDAISMKLESEGELDTSSFDSNNTIQEITEAMAENDKHSDKFRSVCRIFKGDDSSLNADTGSERVTRQANRAPAASAERPEQAAQNIPPFVNVQNRSSDEDSEEEEENQTFIMHASVGKHIVNHGESESDTDDDGTDVPDAAGDENNEDSNDEDNFIDDGGGEEEDNGCDNENEEDEGGDENDDDIAFVESKAGSAPSRNTRLRTNRGKRTIDYREYEYNSADDKSDPGDDGNDHAIPVQQKHTSNHSRKKVANRVQPQHRVSENACEIPTPELETEQMNVISEQYCSDSVTPRKMQRCCSCSRCCGTKDCGKCDRCLRSEPGVCFHRTCLHYPVQAKAAEFDKLPEGWKFAFDTKTAQNPEGLVFISSTGEINSYAGHISTGNSELSSLREYHKEFKKRVGLPENFHLSGKLAGKPSAKLSVKPPPTLLNKGRKRRIGKRFGTPP